MWRENPGGLGGSVIIELCVYTAARTEPFVNIHAAAAKKSASKKS
jgi:hypothetical protein